jgi:hypothetical protein
LKATTTCFAAAVYVERSETEERAVLFSTQP